MKYTKMEKNCFDISQLLITSHTVYTILDLVLESKWKYFEVTGSIVKLSESSKNIILAQKKKKKYRSIIWKSKNINRKLVVLFNSALFLVYFNLSIF